MKHFTMNTPNVARELSGSHFLSSSDGLLLVGTSAGKSTYQRKLTEILAEQGLEVDIKTALKAITPKEDK